MRSITLACVLSLVASSLTAQAAPLVVRGLAFEGNHAIDDLTLAAAISTTNSSAFARYPLLRSLGLGEKRYFNETQFRQDVLRLVVVYRASGFPDVQVDTTVTREAGTVSVRFRITEGEPTRLARLDITGLDSIAEREALLRDLPIRTGDVFSRYRLAEAADTIVTRLRNRGRPTAELREIRVGEDRELRTGQATIAIAAGNAATFGTVRVAGMDQVDSAFIASLVTTRPGRPYQLDALYRSQRALYATDLFRFASVGIDTTRFAAGDSVVPIAVQVTEGRAHRARSSAGFATNDCFRVGLGWTARNFLGNGRVVDVSGRLSKIGVGEPTGLGLENSLCSPLERDTVGSSLVNYGVDVSLRRNGFLGPDNTLVLALFSERRSEYTVYLREEVGAEIALTRETARRIPVTVGYRVGYGLTRANAASFCAFFNACEAADVDQLTQRRVLTMLTVSAARQRVNNLLDPTRGTTLTAEAAVSSRYLGSSRLQQFVRLVVEGAAFAPLTRDVVLATRLRAGAIFAPAIDISTGQGNFIPPEQRFYAGGANDVRGFGRNELGPLVYVVPAADVRPDDTFDAADARVAATGGSRTAVANVELRLPSPVLPERLRFAVFADAGAVWGATSPARARITPGAGLRFASPLGPIRFDIGYNPYRLEAGSVYTPTADGNLRLIRQGYVRDRDRPYTIHFSVGHAF